ncbi:NAD(P)H-dependent oxidoreductase subunit E [Abyssalbus ytuae]|uniref:NAD(P)H-dependent oxidoreductase subunit E n=1 Tax=Abyssalbus ytuae TaxID=2926907 RepID=A0A9E6ZML9_9FLAO|nr:NAD(P)H-dependent oxidoreductase subunit E [Abyssalbus ytuae]UOB17105.1 NAD(P)H-dependent oxidoreductase subunit E [Abyssalbus ytuae]
MASLNNSACKTSIMNVLWDIQKKRRFISSDDVARISKEFNISQTELDGVVSFYHFYHRKHSGKYTIYLNNSIVSGIKDFDSVKKAFEEEAGVSFGNVSQDKMFGLFETSCIGLSDQETSALINFRAFTNLTPEKVKNIMTSLKNGAHIDSLTQLPQDNIRYTPETGKTVFFNPYAEGSSLNFLKKMSPGNIIELVKNSKLSGRGGAFFPTGLKWQLCKNNEADQKYVICNADEGEPGTFKDRVLMNTHPQLLLEGMIIAGYAVGASVGIIYLRAEYFYLKEKLEKIIEDYNQKGFLGKNILGIEDFNFYIYIHMGAGAYVCGEETALINSMEGKRGEPTTKEFFPVEKGFLGKPTIVNNVETLCAVPRIMEMGLEKYLSIGTKVTPGTKIMSVSGDCKKPGIYEIEWGMKLKDFLDLIEAENPYFILYNGFAGECLSPADFEREISGENLLAEHIQFNFDDPIEYAQKMSAVGLRSGGSFMVFKKERDLLSIIKNISDFFVAESCGICVPCRTGNYLLNRQINKILLHHADKNDLKQIQQWSNIIKQTSRCGLGKTSTNCLLTAVLKFPDEFNKCLQAESDINKAFNLEKAVQDYNEIINEIETTYG